MGTLRNCPCRFDGEFEVSAAVATTAFGQQAFCHDLTIKSKLPLDCKENARVGFASFCDLAQLSLGMAERKRRSLLS